MNLDVLTPSMWETLRKLDYNQLIKFSEMMQPVSGNDKCLHCDGKGYDIQDNNCDYCDGTGRDND